MTSDKRRIGVVGVIAVVGFIGVSVALFIRFTSTPTDRMCRGAGTTQAPTDKSPDAAIASFARQQGLAPWFGTTALPADGWFRRGDRLYEHSAPNGVVLQSDVAERDDGWAVTGVWVCTPLPS